MPKYNTNYTHYDLHFKGDELSSFWVLSDGGIGHYGESQLKESLGENWKLKNDSVKLIDEMLSYQDFYKNQYRQRFLNERLEGAKYAGYDNEKYQKFIEERNGWNKKDEPKNIQEKKTKKFKGIISKLFPKV